jgi:hypothetical protein
MAERVHARLSASEGRRFGGVVGGAFLVLGAVLLWRGHSRVGAAAAAAGAALVVAALVVPTRLGPVRAAWMGLAERISRVTTPVFMTLVFALAVVPSGLIARAFGHRPLSRARGAKSFWADREADQRRSDLRRQF